MCILNNHQQSRDNSNFPQCFYMWLDQTNPYAIAPMALRSTLCSWMDESYPLASRLDKHYIIFPSQTSHLSSQLLDHVLTNDSIVSFQHELIFYAIANP